jgi:chromosome segregation ATPase
MEILYIGLGILSSIIIFLLGYSANGVFNGKKQITELRERIHTLDMNLGNIEEHIHIRINSEYKELQSNIDEVERDVIALLDSRLDKLENKLINKIPPTNDEVLSRMEDVVEQIKNLKQEFLTLRENL